MFYQPTNEWKNQRDSIEFTHAQEIWGKYHVIWIFYFWSFVRYSCYDDIISLQSLKFTLNVVFHKSPWRPTDSLNVWKSQQSENEGDGVEMEGITGVFSLKVSARNSLAAQSNSTYKESDKGFFIIGERRTSL